MIVQFVYCFGLYTLCKQPSFPQAAMILEQAITSVTSITMNQHLYETSFIFSQGYCVKVVDRRSKSTEPNRINRP